MSQEIETRSEERQLKSYPILKRVSEPQKITSAAGIALEMRQVYIFAAMVVLPMVIYQLLLSHFISLNFGQGAAIMIPVTLTATSLAFFKYDDRELAWWLWKYTIGSVKEDRLVWRARDPLNLQDLRDSVQAYIPGEKIYWDMLKNTTGVYTLAVEVDPVSLSLASTEDQQRFHDQLAGVYDRIDFPFVEVSGAKPGNVSRYIERTRNDIERVIREDAATTGTGEISALSAKQERFLEYGAHHLQWLESLVGEHGVYERAAYIVLPYRSSSTYAESIQALQEILDLARKLLGKPLGRFLPFLRGPSRAEAAAAQRLAEKAHGILSERAAVFAAAYEPLGIEIRVLEGTELVNIIREQAGGGDLIHAAGAKKPAPDEHAIELFSPVTLTDADGYGELSPERLDKVLARVEENRRSAPPVVGIGELGVADMIAPEAIKVTDSYLKVNDTYHATMFVYDLPDKVHFGILDRFLRMEGKVRISKYINPVSKEKAEKVLSNKISDLIAAEAGTGGNNVRDEKRRAMAYNSATNAHDKILMDEESYFEVAIIVHCEADSANELRSLVEHVRTKLKGALARAKLARQEMLEGYMSSQMFGTNSLTRRHCTRGILTNPLACLFTFGSFKLEHPDGVLYGLDADSHSHVIFDHKELPNQHMIVFGKPGMGKSFAVKVMATRKRIKGESIVLVDPEGNTGYDRAAKAVGGEYVVLGLGSPHKINPLDIRADYMNLTVLAGADDTEDPGEATRRAKSGAFFGKIQKLVDLVMLMAAKDEGLSTNISSAVQGKLERLFVATYNDFGITSEPTTHSKTPPIMTDFFERLAVAADRDADLEALRSELYQWEQGSLSEVFNGQTNVDLDSKFLVLQISAANEGKGKAPIMYSMLDYLSGRLSNPEESITCYIDEQWSLLKFRLAVELMNELWRVGRVRNTSMVGITQDILEFVSSEKSETIIRLSSTKMLLGQNRKTIDAIGRYVALSHEQQTRVANFTKGQALLCVDEDKQVPLLIVASELEKRIFNTDPNLAKKYRAEEQKVLTKPAESSNKEIVGDLGTLRPLPAVPEDFTPEDVIDGAIAVSGDSTAYEETIREDLETEIGLQTSLEPSRNTPSTGSEDKAAPVYEDAVPQHPEEEPSPEEPSPKELSREESGMSTELVKAGAGRMPISAAALAPVFAVTGKTGSMVGFELAGVLAFAGRERGVRVLLVDAGGALSEKHFGGVVSRDAGKDLADYLINEPSTELNALVYPSGGQGPEEEFIDSARAKFDLIVVTVGDCKKRSPYGRSWLVAAHAVIATGSAPADIAADVENSEQIRQSNGTILAPMGRPKLPEDLAHRKICKLPSVRNQALSEAYKAGDFATVTSEQAARSFVGLAAEVVGLAEEVLEK